MYDELVKRLRSVKDSWQTEEESWMLEAADAIETMCEMVATAHGELANVIQNYEESKPCWIPVTERLPEPNAVDKYGFAKGYMVKTDRHVMMHTARYNGEWWILWGKAEVITDTVTHWMPLPELPKEG